jgi:death-on-curing protein
MEAIVYHIAASNIDEELLLRIITCVVECQDFDEKLKIDLIHAMGKDSLFQ